MQGFFLQLIETLFYYSQAIRCLPSNGAGEKKQEMEAYETKSYEMEAYETVCTSLAALLHGCH